MAMNSRPLLGLGLESVYVLYTPIAYCIPYSTVPQRPPQQQLTFSPFQTCDAPLCTQRTRSMSTPLRPVPMIMGLSWLRLIVASTTLTGCRRVALQVHEMASTFVSAWLVIPLRTVVLASRCFLTIRNYIERSAKSIGFPPDS
jgi:hypothetical protein